MIAPKIITPENFNATTSRVQFSGNVGQSPFAQTICAKTRLRGAGEAATGGYIYANLDSGAINGIILRIRGDTNTVSFVSNSTTANAPSRTTSFACTTNNTQNIAATYDGTVNSSGINMYVSEGNSPLSLSNGSGVDGSVTVFLTGGTPTVGNNLGQTRTFNGDIFWVARWNRVLSTAELQIAHTYGPQFVPSGLIFHYVNGQDIGPYNVQVASRVAVTRGVPSQFVPMLRGMVLFKNVSYTPVATQYVLLSDVGALAETGVAASLERGLVLNADVGAFAETGVSAGLLRGIVIPTAVGSYALSGVDASLVLGKVLNADVGALALSGVSAALLRETLIPTATGSYILTGVNALAGRNLDLLAAAGAYTLSGVSAALLAERQVLAATGSFSLTGVEALLTSVLSYTLDGGVGSFSLTGVDAQHVRTRLFDVAAGSFTLTGVSTTLALERTLLAGIGAFNATGISADLPRGLAVMGATGSYTLTGISADLVPTVLGHTSLLASPGSFALTGTDAALLKVGQYALNADVGSYAVTGTSAQALCGRTLNADIGALSLAGIDVSALIGRAFDAAPGSYAFTGNDARLVRLAATFDGSDLRTFAVTAEERAFAVAAERRAYAIAAEERAFAVTPEERAHSIAAEERSYAVQPQERSKEL